MFILTIGIFHKSIFFNFYIIWIVWVYTHMHLIYTYIIYIYKDGFKKKIKNAHISYKKIPDLKEWRKKFIGALVYHITVKLI